MSISCGHHSRNEAQGFRLANFGSGLKVYLRRYTRLTNAFSKKLDNLKAAVTLYVAFYNFCRTHQTLRVTPAMEAV